MLVPFGSPEFMLEVQPKYKSKFINANVQKVEAYLPLVGDDNPSQRTFAGRPPWGFEGAPGFH